MSCLKSLKSLRIEPFIFLFMFSFALEGLTITQMAQDKICLYKYQMSSDYCSRLSEKVSTDSIYDFKNQVLSDVTTFSLYRTVISTIPIIFWSLFLGAWADKHESAPKFLMTIASIASCIESILLILNSIYFDQDEKWILLSFIPQSLCGGFLGTMMSVYSYVSATTEPQFRTIKYAILEAIIFVATPIGLFIGGDVIGAKVQGDDGQLHRYTRVFAIGLIAQILSVLWIIFIPLEERIYGKGSKSVAKNENECTPDIDVKERFMSNEERQPLINKSVVGAANQEIKNVESVLQLSLSQQEISSQNDNISDLKYNSFHLSRDFNRSSDKVHWYVMFKDLLDFQNVRDMWHTCTKVRSNGKRGEIWILLISLTLISLTTNGSNGIMFQFVQRVFEWNAEIFSIVNASTLLITSLSVIIIVPTLIKVLNFSNMSLSIVGIISISLQNLIRGTILNAEAFYISYAIGSLAYVPAISVRSKLSTIVEDTEENKVFGLLATFETMTPFLGSILYSTLFTATIATYPGLVFHFSAAILLIPFIGFVYISNHCE